MQNNLADIVKVDIDIQSPVVDNTSFDNLLIIGPEPATVYNDTNGTVIENEYEAPDVGSYTSLAGVTEMGWDAVDNYNKNGELVRRADPVGAAARIAFSQNPKPAKIYIAVRKRTEIGSAYLCEKMESLPDEIGTFYEKVESSETSMEVIANDSVLDNPLKQIHLADVYPTIDGYTPQIGDHVANTFSEIPGSPYLVVKFPTGVGDVSVRKGVNEYRNFITVRDSHENVTFLVISLNDEASGVFYIETPTSMNVNKEVKVRYVCAWNADDNSCKVQTVNLSDYEDVEDTLNRALEIVGWYVICPAGIDKDEFISIAQWTEAQTKIALFPLYSTEKSAIGNNVFYRSAEIYCKTSEKQADDEIPNDNHYINVALAAKCLNYKSGSETWAFKTLAGISPASLTSTQMDHLKSIYASYYTTYASKNITQGGWVTGGEWIDVIRFRDWLQNNMQIKIYNLLVTQPKIPYTDHGIALVQNQMIASLREGQAAGGIAQTEYDEDDNEIPGFITHIPLAASISASQKASRKLVDCTFSARLAGAIHVVEVKGSLTYEFV